jgi:hypothetical protein
MGRPDPLAGWEPRWGKLLVGSLFATLPVLIVLNFLPGGGLVLRVYVGVGWFCAVAVAVTASRISAFRKLNNSMRRRDQNRCRQCGYDLTSNMSGVCPECGTPCPPPLFAR